MEEGMTNKMDHYIQKGLCIAPWKSLCVKSNGHIVPDIHFRGSLGNIRNSELYEILNQEAIQSLRRSFLSSGMGDACGTCKAKELSGGHSRRIFFNDVVYPHVKNIEWTPDGGADIHYLEINTSNKCNLKCRMCSGNVSTAWKSDEMFLTKHSSSLDRPAAKDQSLTRDDIDRLFSRPEVFRNLKFLALRGGEPLFEETNLYIFEKIQQMGLAKNVVLDISTNGTFVSPAILKALRSFQSLQIYISMEGLGERYKYIRGGNKFKIDDVEKTIELLRSLPRVQFVFTYTTMAYNVGRINQFWNWYCGVRQSSDLISFSNTVVNPSYLNFQILPNELKRKIADEIKTGPIFQSQGIHKPSDIGIIPVLRGLENDNYFSANKKRELCEKFKVFNELLDKNRKTSFKDVFPELNDFYDSIRLDNVGSNGLSL